MDTQLDWSYIEDHKVPNKASYSKEIEIFCPECGAENFKIDSRTGKYWGWSCSCMEGVESRKRIAKAIHNFPDNKNNQTPFSSSPRKVQKGVPVKVSKDKGDMNLKICRTRGESPATKFAPPAWGTSEYKYIKNSLQKQVEADNASLQSVVEYRYPYSETQWVSRFEWPNTLSEQPKQIARREQGKLYAKTVRQAHCHGNNIYWKKGDAPWPPYRVADCDFPSGNVVLLVEGEPACDAGHRMGFATVTLQGSTWRDFGPLFESVPASHKIIFLTDSDEPGQKKGASLLSACEEFGRQGAAISMAMLYPELARHVHGLDLADIEAEGEKVQEEFSRRLKREVEQQQQQKQQESHGQPTPPNPSPASGEKESKVQKTRRVLDEWLDGRSLRLNQLTKEIEVDGENIPLESIYVGIGYAGHNVSLNVLQMVISDLAESQAYHPIRDYLQECERNYAGDFDLESLASRYLGNSTPIAQVMVKKFLLGAAERVLSPGCQMDASLILQGKQGVGKSSFFRVLAGDDWFSDSMGSIEGKDDLMQAHSSWFNEWAELECLFSRSDVSKVKSFLTARVDRFRTPYAREITKNPRQFVVVGSTNNTDFLRDPTGARRSWIVECGKKVDLGLLRQERDQLWGAIMHARSQGASYELTAEEKRQQQEMAENYQALDPWEVLVQERLQGFVDDITIDRLFDHLGIEVQKRGAKESARIGAILTSLGWTRRRKMKGGVRKYYYCPPAELEPVSESEAKPEPEPVSEPEPEVEPEDSSEENTDSTDSEEDTDLAPAPMPGEDNEPAPMPMEEGDDEAPAPMPGEDNEPAPAPTMEAAIEECYEALVAVESRREYNRILFNFDSVVFEEAVKMWRLSHSSQYSRVTGLEVELEVE